MNKALAIGLNTFAIIATGLIVSCTPQDEIGDYPLPRHGGGRIMTNNLGPASSPSLINELQDTNTLGSSVTPPAVADPLNPAPVIPGISSNNGGTTSPMVTPATPSIPKVTPPSQGTKFPYAIKTEDPFIVLSPYDNKPINIRGADGRPIPSGKVIRAQGETDPNRKFIIP